LPKTLFAEKGLGNVHLSVWKELIEDSQVSPAVLAGYLFGCMLTSELSKTEQVEMSMRGKSTIIRRRDLISSALANKNLQQLSYFPQIKSLAERNSLFT
jgi:hypothetical protein